MDKNVCDDLPPEFCQYRDEGCDVEPSCLACQLPRCIHDEPSQSRRLKHRQRDNEIRRAYRQGSPIPGLIQRFHISRRTVYRILQRSKE